MKNQIYYLAVAIIISLSSCVGCSSQPQVSSYETRYSPNGDSTVYVHYVDNSGRDQSFFMDYLLFSTLYSHGGYGSCYGYYNNHPGYFHSPRYNQYRNYQSKTVIHNHYGGNSDAYMHQTNRSRISTTSSPNRSASQNRSSSSPSRTYSSPSRSYSSPSRSYSSPSHSSFHSSSHSSPGGH